MTCSRGWPLTNGYISDFPLFCKPSLHQGGQVMEGRVRWRCPDACGLGAKDRSKCICQERVSQADVVRGPIANDCRQPKHVSETGRLSQQWLEVGRLRTTITQSDSPRQAGE